MAVATRPFRPRSFLLATWAVNVCINAFYISPAPVFPAMIDDLGITKALAGSLISFYLLSILLFQLPSGFVMDRTDPRELIVLSSIALFGLSAGMTLVPVYEVLLVLRVLAGIPVAFIFAPSAFLVSRAFERTPGRAVGLFLSAPPAGVALGNLVAPWVALAFGWPAVFVAFNVPLLAALPFFRAHAASLPARTHEPFGVSDFLAAFRNRELWKVGAAFAASYAAYIFYASWTPTYLTESAILEVASIAVLSSAIPAAGILARPLGGLLAETRFAHDKRWVPALGFVGLVAASASIPFLGLAGGPLLVAAGFLAQFPFSVYYLFSAQVLPRKFGGTAYAFMNTVSLVGGAISPGLAGLLADVTGSFVAAFAMVAAGSVLGLAALAAVRER
ncbi:MAG: MFS transporter [Methanobacteriota archaeon]